MPHGPSPRSCSQARHSDSSARATTRELLALAEASATWEEPVNVGIEDWCRLKVWSLNPSPAPRRMDRPVCHEKAGGNRRRHAASAVDGAPGVERLPQRLLAAGKRFPEPFWRLQDGWRAAEAELTVVPKGGGGGTPFKRRLALMAAL